MGCGSSIEVEKCNFDEKDKVCNTHSDLKFPITFGNTLW